MRDIIRHYLSEKNDWVACPFNRKFQCDNRCAWFDNENQDCRMIGGFWKVKESLNEVNKNLDAIWRVVQ